MQVKITRSLIPNLFTLMNMFCGFLSIINTFEGKFHYASSLIVIAAIFDLLDGLAARITKSASEFGVELDSLSDIISFGAAPSLLIYKIKLFEYSEIGVLMSAFFLVSVALRLARFNVQLVDFDKKHFYGLPSPLGAITIASYVLFFYNTNYFISFYGGFLLPLSVLISILMISKIKYDAFPKINLKELKSRPFYFLFLIATVIITLATSGKGIFFMITAFILYGLLRAAIKLGHDIISGRHEDSVDEITNFNL